MRDRKPGGDALGGGIQDSGRGHLRDSSNNTDSCTMDIYRRSSVEEHGHPNSRGGGSGTDVPNDGYPEGTDATDHYTSSGTINTDDESAFLKQGWPRYYEDYGPELDGGDIDGNGEHIPNNLDTIPNTPATFLASISKSELLDAAETTELRISRTAYALAGQTIWLHKKFHLSPLQLISEALDAGSPDRALHIARQLCKSKYQIGCI